MAGWRTWLAGGILAAAAIPLGLWGNWAAAIVVSSGGIALIAAATPASPRQSSASVSSALHELLASTGFTGNPIHLAPIQGAARWFVPAEEIELQNAPAWDQATIVARGGGSAIGAFLEPPGQSLLEQWNAEAGLPKGQGIEEAFHVATKAFKKMGWGQGLRATRTATNIVFEWTSPDGGRAQSGDSVALQQCDIPLASLLALLIVFATRQPCRVIKIENVRSKIRVKIEVA